MSGKRVRQLEAENRLLKIQRTSQVNSALAEAEARLSAFATPAVPTPAASPPAPRPPTLREQRASLRNEAERLAFVLSHEAELSVGDGWDAPAWPAEAPKEGAQ
jgi:hypothetical protein